MTGPRHNWPCNQLTQHILDEITKSIHIVAVVVVVATAKVIYTLH